MAWYQDVSNSLRSKHLHFQSLHPQLQHFSGVSLGQWWRCLWSGGASEKFHGMLLCRWLHGTSSGDISVHIFSGIAIFCLTSIFILHMYIAYFFSVVWILSLYHFCTVYICIAVFLETGTIFSTGSKERAPQQKPWVRRRPELPGKRPIAVDVATSTWRTSWWFSWPWPRARHDFDWEKRSPCIFKRCLGIWTFLFEGKSNFCHSVFGRRSEWNCNMIEQIEDMDMIGYGLPHKMSEP